MVRQSSPAAEFQTIGSLFFSNSEYLKYYLYCLDWFDVYENDLKYWSIFKVITLTSESFGNN